MTDKPKLKKARPSGMKTASLCALSPWLAHRHQFLKAEMAVGSDVDGEVTTTLRGGPEPRALAAMEIVAWVREKYGTVWTLEPQRFVKLVDQEMGDLLTEGTTDLLAHTEMRSPEAPHRWIEVHVADWKKKGQLFAGYIEHPDDHPQQLAYGLGAALELDAAAFTVHHVFFNGPDDDNIEVRSSKRYEAKDFPALLARFRAMPDVDLDGPEPPATEGDHCNTCWQQRWCAARMLPPAETELVQFTPKGELTHERLAEAIPVLEKYEAATKLQVKKAWDMVQGLIQLHGPVVVNGREYGFFEKKGNRRGPTVAELEAGGHGDLIKAGEVKTVFTDRKAG